MATHDPIWSYGETKVIETDPYWSYGESVYYGEPVAIIKKGVSSNIPILLKFLME